MKKIVLLGAWLLSLTATAQTARKLVVNITSDGTANMTVYLPENPSGRALVGCPGGGYQHLSMQNEGHDWASFFNSKGIAYGVLTYRMPNGDRTIPLSDAQNAIRTMRDSADVWHISPNDVGIMGFSAGGHLASATATHAPFEARPNFQILFYPVITMNEKDTHKSSVRNFLGKDSQNEKLVKEFSSDRAVRRHRTPPAIILTANDDRTVPPVNNAIAYYSAMRRQGNVCALHVYPTGGHGFGMRTTFRYHDQMLNDLSEWLNTLPSPKADAIRVACIGNSITDGHGIDVAETFGYPAQLQALLGEKYLVKNFGVSGRTMLQHGNYPYMVEPMWTDAKAFLPQIAIIKLGTNDSKPANWDPYKSEYERDLMQMINELRALPSKPRIYLCTPLQVDHKTRADDPMLIRNNVIEEEIIPLLRKVAKREKLTIIDLHPLIDPNGPEMLKDGIHPNDKGARKMAEAVAAALK